MSVLNILQYLPYKQCLCILTLPKCNAQFIDQIFTIYRPEKCLKWNKQYKLTKSLKKYLEQFTDQIRELEISFP